MPVGKFNRIALLNQSLIELQLPDLDPGYITETEFLLADVWRNCLKIPQIKHDADFFVLGGDSIAVIRVQNQIRKVFNVDISFQEFFSVSTLKTMADLIDWKLDQLG
jgi:acyl carrier protein